MRAGPRPWKKPAGPSFLRIWRIVWITLSFLTMASLEELGSPVATVVRTVWRVCEGGVSRAEEAGKTSVRSRPRLGLTG